MLQADPRSVYRKEGGGGAAAAEECFTLYLDCLDVQCAFRPADGGQVSSESSRVDPSRSQSNAQARLQERACGGEPGPCRLRRRARATG